MQSNDVVAFATFDFDNLSPKNKVNFIPYINIHKTIGRNPIIITILHLRNDVSTALASIDRDLYIL